MPSVAPTVTAICVVGGAGVLNQRRAVAAHAGRTLRHTSDIASTLRPKSSE
jgi:hypothetical protein